MPSLGLYEDNYSTGQLRIARDIVVAKTANYTVTQAETGTVFTNSGAGGTVIFTLPTAVSSLSYTIYAIANQLIVVKTGGSNTINFSVMGNQGSARGSTIAIASEGISDGGDMNNVNIGSRVVFTAISSTTWAVRGIDDGWNVGVGYVGGGTTSGDSDVFNGLTFSIDTTAQVTRGSLSVARANLGGFNSSVVGYSSGGATSGNAVTTTDGLTFSTDTTTQTTRGVLSQAKALPSTCNSMTTGYISGGSSSNQTQGTYISSTNGLTFTTDTTAQTTRGVLTVERGFVFGGNNSTIKGYTSGGLKNSDNTPRDTTDALVFSTDTTAQITAGILTVALSSHASFNSSTTGYVSGGNTGAAVSTVNGLLFATDTTAQTTRGVLTQARQDGSGNNSTVVGYTSGGYTGAVVSTVDGLIFATDTTAQATRSSVTSSVNGAASFQSGGTL